MAVLYVVLTLISAGFVIYAQIGAFAWDEGFHILTAQLIKHGKRPYIDFCFSQTPLNAYWNAAWMFVFGESWRTAHVAAALCTAAAVWLTAGFIFNRFPVLLWRVPGAVACTLLIGLNFVIIRFGGIAQAYGFGMLGVVAGFRFALAARDKSNANKSTVFVALSGLACGLAAASSLLSAPAAPVLLIWIFLYSRGSRVLKSAAFIAGVFAAFIPVFGLFVQGPRQVWFGIVDYNLAYRTLDWPGAGQHNLEILSQWIDTGPTLLLLLLAAGGLLYIRFRSGWDSRIKSEFYLCAGLAFALAAYISSVRPTFARYYIFAIPFVAALAIPGLYALGVGLYKPSKPWPPVLVLTFLLVFGLGKSLYEIRDNMVWPDMERVAAKVNAVTASSDSLYADEETYFLTRRTPPSGMEMQNSHKFDFAAERLALLHLIPEAKLRRMVVQGVFHTLETCDEDEEIAASGYSAIYANSAKVGDCVVFWSPRKK